MSARTYQEPRFPDGEFFLVSVPEGWSMGPFTRDGWARTPDGTLQWSDGVTHPVNLRVRGQDGDTLHANDGDVREMDYRMVPADQIEEEAA